MSTDGIVQIYEQLVAAITAQDAAAMKELLDEDFIAFTPGGPEEGMDCEGFLLELGRWAEAFPDFSAKREYGSCASEVGLNGGGTVAACYTMELTHTGRLPWMSGFEPTGTAVKALLTDIVEIGTNDKVVHITICGDRLDILAQVSKAL